MTHPNYFELITVLVVCHLLSNRESIDIDISSKQLLNKNLVYYAYKYNLIANSALFVLCDLFLHCCLFVLIS